MANRNGGANSRQDSPSAVFSLDLAPSTESHVQLPFSNDISHQALAPREDGLLLPNHISIASSSAAVAVTALESNLSELTDSQRDALGSLGDYAEIDGKPIDTMRYYQVQEKEERMSKEECPLCGELGHDKKGCTHTQCLACGVLDEHSTRDCPMGLVCFRCGTTGHRSRDCKVPRQRSTWTVDCARCGASTHVAKNCPTLWRIYAYNEQHEYDAHRAREARELALLRGDSKNKGCSSDMSMSSDDDNVQSQRKHSKRRRRSDWDPAIIWCYNCAAHGHHWGDECPLPRCNLTRVNGEPSAYSHFISITGPFGATLPPLSNSQYQAPPPPPPQPQNYDLRVGANASMRMTTHDYRNSGDTSRFPPRAPRRHNEVYPQGKGKRKGERQFDASLDEDAQEQDWFAQHTSNDARHSKFRSERRTKSVVATSSQKKRRRAPSPSDSEPDNSRGSRRDKRIASVKKRDEKTETPLAARLSQSQRDREANRQRQAIEAAVKPNAAAELETREEQSRRDKEAHRRRLEEQERALQRHNRKRGEPEFGRFSVDETRDEGGSSSHRPLYRGGY